MGGTTQAKVETYTYNNVDDLITATDARGNTIQTEITVEGDAIKTVTKRLIIVMLCVKR